MTTHVLVPIDGSQQSWDALEYAFDQFEGERITVLHVVDPSEGVQAGGEFGYFDPSALERAKERGDRLCEQARERAENADILSSTVLEEASETGRPARGIVTYADEHDVDHIVMGSHGRTGASRILLGSVAETVARRAPVPVTIVR